MVWKIWNLIKKQFEQGRVFFRDFKIKSYAINMIPTEKDIKTLARSGILRSLRKKARMSKE